MTEPPNMISVLSSTAGVLGFLLSSARGVKAFNQDGQPLGYYSDKERAVEAITAVITSGNDAA